MPELSIFDDEELDKEDPFKKEEKKEEKKEDKKEEKEIDDEAKDDEPLKREKKTPKKPAKTEDESIKDLRASRDAERQKNLDLEKRLQDLEKIGNANLEPIAKYIEKKFGSLDDDAVNKYIEKNKGRKKTLTEKETAFAEKEAKLRHYTIEEDEQFKSQYKQPYYDAAESLFATIAPVDAEGKVIQEELFKKFRDQLVSKSGEIDPIKAKGYLKVIGEQYKQITGEDYSATNLSEFMASIRDVNSKKGAMQTAYKSWETEKEAAQQNGTIAQQEANEKRNRAAKQIRKDLAKKAINEFNYEDFDGVIDEDKIEGAFNELYKENEVIFDDSSKLPSYDELLKKGTKSKLFDLIIDDYKRLKAIYEEDEENKRERIPGSDPAPIKNGKESDDEDAFAWMEK